MMMNVFLNPDRGHDDDDGGRGHHHENDHENGRGRGGGGLRRDGDDDHDHERMLFHDDHVFDCCCYYIHRLLFDDGVDHDDDGVEIHESRQHDYYDGCCDDDQKKSDMNVMKRAFLNDVDDVLFVFVLLRMLLSLFSTKEREIANDERKIPKVNLCLLLFDFSLFLAMRI